MKERLQDLGGTMKWISSERQFADSLTKDATKQLLANRLPYRRIKFTWDPEYQASKKKSLPDRNASRDEFSMERPDQQEAGRRLENEDDELMKVVPEQVPVEAYVMVANTKDVIKYVDAVAEMTATEDAAVLKYEYPASHGAGEVYYPKIAEYVAVIHRCWALCVWWLLSYLPGAHGSDALGEGQCGLDEAPEDEENFGVFEAVIGFVVVMIGIVSYYVGRTRGWSYGREHRLQLRHVGYERLVAQKVELEKEKKLSRRT